MNLLPFVRSARLTSPPEVAGSSGYFETGYVTYSNAAKTRQLGVPEAPLAAHGAVSREVLQAMLATEVQRVERKIRDLRTFHSKRGGTAPPPGAEGAAASRRRGAGGGG